MQLNFNAQAVQPQQPMEAVPVGWYPVILKKFDHEANSKPETGWHLAGELEITDGPFKGRKGFINLNLGHTTSAQAVDIAARELSALCYVTNRLVIQDSSELCNIPFQAKFEIDGTRNRINGYKDMAGNDPGKSGGGGAPQTTNMAPPPAQGGWVQPPAQQQQPQGAQGGGWGTPPAQQQAPQGGYAPPPQQQPPAQGGQPSWGQPPAQGGAAPQGQWGGGAPAPGAAPPQQQPGAWTPPPGAQGGAPAWAGGGAQR